MTLELVSKISIRVLMGLQVELATAYPIPDISPVEVASE